MPAEKSPRQPRKPFQKAGKKDDPPRQERKRISRSDSRMEKPYAPKKRDDRPARPNFKKDKPYPSKEGGDRPAKRAFKKDKPYPAREEGERPAKRAFMKDKPYPPREEGARPPKRIFKKDKPFTSRDDSDRPPKRAFKKERPYTPREDGDRPQKRFITREKPRGDREESRRPVKRVIEKKISDSADEPGRKFAMRSGYRIKAVKGVPEGIRLNKYIANSGICSRREADELIKAGVVKVNGEVVSTLGAKVMPGDKVQYGDQTLSNEKKRYLLLNKQKGYVTTTKDPHAKNTVMELIAGACKERIYPVGRLDRNTTGLLLFTNDGEMAKKLMHPRSRIKKLYHVVLDQPLSRANMLKIADGMEIDGDAVQVDSIEYVEDAADRKEIGMEIHSGQNRVIRRIFEQLGHKVVKLDRVVYAGLTKRNLPRGTWRFLTEKEVISLMMMR
jgi:23S rRNA pseudouridine2605 synthase